MSVPMTSDQLLAALRAEGLTVVEVGSWRTHNRNHKGPWGPVHGSMLHHTGSKGEASTVELCRTGYAGLPGPLSQVVIGKSGKVYLLSSGRCNHAGGGDPNVLQAVIDERYNTAPPVPRRGNDNGIDGNAHFYGAECENLGDGKDPWPAVQVDAMVRFSAAISRAHRWTEKSAIAHREWSDDKPDPRGPGLPSMPDMRAKIAERLAHSASWNPSTTGTVMTKPNRLTVRRDENVTLNPGSPYRIYWTTEYQDDGQGHGDGGKTVGTNIHYSAVLSPSLLGLDHGERVEVYPVEEDSSGSTMGAGMPSQIWGQGMGTEAIRQNAAFNGIVGQRLAFEIINRGSTQVTMTEVQAVIFSWPNS